MEFNEKLQELRKQKGLTQEELAQRLFVSRTAVSKWESGRGYPSIDSLKSIAKLFSVTVDQLLSGEEVLTIAQKDREENGRQLLGVIFGLLDLCAAILLFLPIFASRTGGTVNTVSPLLSSELQTYLRAIFIVPVACMAIIGVLTLTLQEWRVTFWEKSKYAISLSLGAITMVVFVLCLQPYPSVLVFISLIIKAFALIKLK